MRLIWMIAFLVVAFGLYLALLWISWEYLSRYSEALLFWPYTLFSGFMLFFSFALSFRIAFRNLGMDSVDRMVLGTAFMTVRGKSFGRTRLIFQIAVSAIQDALSVPALVWNFWQRLTGKHPGQGVGIQAAAQGALEGIPAQKVAFIFFPVICSFYSYALNSASLYATWWACVAILGVLVHIVTIISSGQTFTQMYRRQLGNPYLRFVLRALSMASVLLLGFSILKSQQTYTPLDWNLVWSTAKELFAFGSLLGSFTQIVYSPLTVSKLISSGIFYFFVFRAIWKWKEFTRTDADCCAIARNLIVLGRFNDALDWCRKANASNGGTLLIQGMALVALNRVAEGVASIGKGIESSNPGLSLSPYVVVMGQAAAFLLPARTIAKVVDAWLDTDPPPGPLLFGFCATVYTGLLSDEDIKAFSMDSRMSTRPVHRAFLLTKLGENAEAHNLLKGAILGSEVEETARLVFLLTLGVTPTTSAQDDHAHVHSWLDKELKEIEQLCESMDLLELVSIYGFLLCGLEFIRLVGVRREQELLYVAGKLQDKIMTMGPSNLELKSVLQGMKDMASTAIQ